MECIFCKIIKKELPGDIVLANDTVVAFRDINPVAPVHILIVPREHIPSVNHLAAEHKELIGQMVLVAQDLAKEYKIDQKGYRLIINNGKDVGQTINHLHLHLIGGKELAFN